MRQSASNVSGKDGASVKFLHGCGPPKLNDEWNISLADMRSYFEASTFVDMTSVQKLHKVILVKLGFSMKLKRFDQTESLTACLLSLYQCACNQESGAKNGYAEMYFGKQEIKESFTLVLQALEALKEKTASLQLIGQLLLYSPDLRDLLHSNRKLLESVLYALVDIPKCLEFTTKTVQAAETAKAKLFSILRSISPNVSQLVRLAEAINSEDHKLVKSLVKSLSSKDDQVFYMNYLIINNAPARCINHSGLHEAISFTKEKYLGKNQLSSGVDCFCLMIDDWNMGIDAAEFFEVLLTVLVDRSYNADLPAKVVVHCFETLTRTSRTRQMLLESKGLDSVIRFLSSMVVNDVECRESRVQAVDVLCTIAISVQELGVFEAKKWHDPFLLITSLLSSENPDVFKRVVSCIYKLLQIDNKTRSARTTCCNLILLLADASFHEFTSKTTRQEVVEIFYHFAQRDDTLLNFISRQPSVVAMIVRAASVDNRITSGRIAFSLLSAMSRNACNHRILARQPGLLSALIDYTRGETDNDVLREKTKENILSLARSL